MLPALLLVAAASLPLAASHAALFHPSMWGFNVTMQTFPYDNRPVAPLTNYTFEEWWFHGHLDYPPNPGDYFELPAGQTATTQIACDKGATTYYASDPGGDIQQGDNVCPGSPMSEYHTTGFDDLKGCSLAIAYESDETQVQPENFTVFSINQTCVWTRFTDFQVPARMPPCPVGGCICSFFWIHSADSGGEQNYMNAFRCNVTNSTSDVPVAVSQVPRRCGADPANGKPDASPGNCTYGAKTPFYWFQAERNNMFEGTYSPPYYTDLYNFLDGSQDDIFTDSYPGGIPPPSPNSTVVPTPYLGGTQSASTAAPSATSMPLSSSSASATSTPVSSGVTWSVLVLSSTLPLSSTSPVSSGSNSTASGSSATPTSSVFSPPYSISTATVISTIVVTVTAPAAPSSAVSGIAASASVSTSDVPTPPASSFSSQASGAPSSSSAPSAAIPASSGTAPSSGSSAIASSASIAVSASSSSITPAATTILLNNPSVSATPSLPSNGTFGTPAALFDVDNPVLAVAATSSLSSPLASSTNSMCRRQFTRRTFQRRSLPTSDDREFVEAQTEAQASVGSGGLRGNKHLYDRSRLWRIW